MLILIQQLFINLSIIPENVEDTTILLTFKAEDRTSGYINTETAIICVGKDLPEVITAKNETLHFFSVDYTQPFVAKFGADGVVKGGKDLDGDIYYCYHPVNKDIIASADNKFADDYGQYNGQSYDYSSKSHTILVPDNSIDFDSLDYIKVAALNVEENEAVIFDSGVGKSNVAACDIFKFKTADGRLGVLKVTQVKASKLESDIKYDVIYQKTPTNNN